MNVPEMTAIFMSWVCVWRGVVNPAGNLVNPPYAPFVWSPHTSATLTPGAPLGSSSVHFRSAAGTMTAFFPPAFGALFAFAAPDPCARTDAARMNDTAKAMTFLDLIETLLMLL